MIYQRWLPLATLLLILGALYWGEITSQRWKTAQWITVSSGFFYLAVVIWLTFYPTGLPFCLGLDKPLFHFMTVSYNLHPLAYVDAEFFANILLTVPLGVYLYLAKSRLNLLNLFLISIIPGLMIESCQLVADLAVNLNRVVDIDDVISNTCGVLVGYLVVKLFDHTPLTHLVKPFALQRNN